ncbi:MAG: Fis family transcriptional regulator, partial [Desulfuromonas sp.]
MIIDDEKVIREGLRRILEAEDHTTELCASGSAAMDRIQNIDVDLIITDLKMPGMSGIDVLKSIRILQPDIPVIMITGYSTVDTAVDAMKHGAADYITKPFTPENILKFVKRAFEQKSVIPEDLYLKKELRDHHGFENFIGESRDMQKLYRRILQVSQTDSTVLITGESGTGKELVAKAIHNNSGRREQPLVAVDCTALSENLLESELFGHIKGSFTGALQSKTGLFKVADQGTLFLDEISNLSLRTQAKLLRALQEREVTPIGGTRPLPVNIRLIAATNRNLKEMVEAGDFREDLYFRLNIIPIELVPLRERKSDL